uniref:Uncharacterized protein n=1 Tax=Panagrolaimus sp. PS1159 TaxID=55785 RepID=A0AC35EZR7_9BILA
MARHVHFADEADEERFSLDKRIPTPHPRKFGAAGRRRDSTSSSGNDESSHSSNSDSSRRRGILSKRGIISRQKQREDGRGSEKERKRKSQLARALPRRSNGKFAPVSGFVTPPNRSSKPQQQQQSDPEESFLNTTDPKLPPGRYINDLVQTPEGQKRLQRSIVKSVEKVLAKTIERLGEGTRLNFDSDSDEPFLNTTGPKLPAGKYIQQFVQTPEGQKLLRKQLMKALNEMGGSLLNFDSDDDEQDRNKNPTPPRQRRSSS